MATAFLIGGGREDAQIRASHAPFVAACGGGPIVAFALDDPERWEGALRLAGATDVRCMAAPPTADDLAAAAGVFVGGGWTPGYQEALAGWRAPDLPYAGFSAGAAVASARAIVGGWRLGERAICAEEAGEDIDQLELRDGLGLVPFAVDVHATQWGTLTASRTPSAPASWTRAGRSTRARSSSSTTAPCASGGWAARTGWRGRTATSWLACSPDARRHLPGARARSRVEERPEPELSAPDDAIVRVEATGVCGSDLHIYHGRVKIEPGFTIGHEFVGTVVAAGDAVSGVAVGDRVLGCFQVACGTCWLLPPRPLPQVRRTRAPSATAGRSARCRARRPSWRSSRTPTSRCGACRRACPTTSRCSPAT